MDLSDLFMIGCDGAVGWCVELLVLLVSCLWLNLGFVLRLISVRFGCWICFGLVVFDVLFAWFVVCGLGCAWLWECVGYVC